MQHCQIQHIEKTKKKPPALKTLPPTDANLCLSPCITCPPPDSSLDDAYKIEPPTVVQDITKLGWTEAKENSVMPVLSSL